MHHFIVAAVIALSPLASAFAETYEAPLDTRAAGEARLTEPVKVAKAASMNYLYNPR
jgi:hypothetical protein